MKKDNLNTYHSNEELGCKYNPANDTGSYSTIKGQSWESLSLSGKKEDYVAYKIEVLEDISTTQSLVTPWFNQPGGGVQYKFEKSIEDLANPDTGAKLKLIGEL